MRTVDGLVHLLISSKYFLHARGDGPAFRDVFAALNDHFLHARGDGPSRLCPNGLDYIIFSTTRVGILTMVVNEHHHHFSTSVGMDRAETVMRRSTRTFLHFGGDKEL